jgi:hypothetical protein
MILVFIVSLMYCWRKSNPTYLRIFPFYHLVAILTEIFMEIYYINENSVIINSTVPYILFVLFEFSFFSIFIFKQLHFRKLKLFWLIAITFYIITHIAFLFIKDLNDALEPFIIIENIFLVIGCLIYYYDFFTELSILKVSKEPSFWIINGILLLCLIETPLLGNFLTSKYDVLIKSVLYCITNGAAYMLMYLLFIKAYTCRILK